MTMYKITAIPALQDNYIWAIHNQHEAVVVDPGETAPVLAFLAAQGLELTGILCTHRHHDHIGGISGLRAVYNVPVYGRRHDRNPHITDDLREGDKLGLTALGLELDIMEIPGHLDDHLAFFAAHATPPLLFCGDVLFGAGCGKNFEGTTAQLHRSLQRISRLPGETLAYCAHEYTASNLRFALVCDPDNPDVQLRAEQTRKLRADDQPTVPFTIALENATNPFMRCNQPGIVKVLEQRGLLTDSGEQAVFAALRAWRDSF